MQILTISSSYFLSLLIFCLCCFNNESIATISLPKNETVPTLIIFGDSIVDPGNNNYIKTTVKCNFPPYGEDFMGGLPTGRFSNGKISSDLIAEEFGIKELLPAYLNPNLKIQDLLSGVSFASGGSGYDPLTSQLMSVLSLSEQLDLFKSYIEKLKAAVGENRTTTILSNSIVMVCSGSDDIANTYFTTPYRRSKYDIHSYTDLMLRSASNFVQELYGLGARKIGVFSAPPIGCVPSQRTLGGGLQRGCAQLYNQAAMLFNSKLISEIDSLNRKLPTAKLVYMDIYTPTLSLVQNPAQFGFEVVNKGCCGTGLIEASILCNPTDTTCRDVEKYVFWDSYHPTERAAKILVQQVLSKQMNKFF